MISPDFTQELVSYFHHDLHEQYRSIAEACKPVYASMPNGLNVYERKAFTYRMIADHCRPKVFAATRLYCDIGTQPPRSDGADYSAQFPGAWNFRDHQHLFYDFMSEQDRKHLSWMCSNQFIKLCGPCGDERIHFSFHIESVLQHGFEGVLRRAEERLQSDISADQAAFLHGVCEAMQSIRRICERFAEEARRLAAETDNPSRKAHFLSVADAADHAPWHSPRSFFEALNCFAFCQLVISSLEGIALEGMGRLDFLLTPFYTQGIADGTLSKSDAYQLLEEFCCFWNLRVYQSEDERGTYDPSFAFTLGGCDGDGAPFCSDVTLMILDINHKHKLIYPKLKCRYSFQSPDDYLTAINEDIVDGRTNGMYQNDDQTIPALRKRSVSEEDAVNYSILGCWEPVVPQSADEHCNYLNLLKILEQTIFHDITDPATIPLAALEDDDDFETVYRKVLDNIRRVVEARCSIVRIGRDHWHDADALLLLSAVTPSCLDKAQDYTQGGMKYYVDEIICTGFVNVLDSLLAIKSVCFDKNASSLKSFLEAVRSNWEGAENTKLRSMALSSPFFGDESEESCRLAARLNHDLFLLTDGQTRWQNGPVVIGHMLYREMDEWCKTIRATPDGRLSGDWFSRGYAPSFLHPMQSVTAVLNSLRAIDTTENAGNSVLNVIMTFKPNDIQQLNAFVRTSARCHIQSLQLNNVTREDLEDALTHPDRHRDLVVRVCGYSARFISLEKDTQTEFLHRNFYH